MKRRSKVTARTPRSRPRRCRIVPRRIGGILAVGQVLADQESSPGQHDTKYAMFDLEDTAGMMRSIILAEDFATYGEMIKADAIVAVRGVIDKRPGSEEANLIVNEVMPLADLATRYTRGVIDPLGRGAAWRARAGAAVRDSARLSRQLRTATGSLLGRRQPGDCAPARGLRVEMAAEMRRRVEELLGPGSLRPVASRPKPARRMGTMATVTTATPRRRPGAAVNAAHVDRGGRQFTFSHAR